MDRSGDFYLRTTTLHPGKRSRLRMAEAGRSFLMMVLQATTAGERLRPAECEVGDWIASSRLPDWSKKLPVHEYAPAEGSEPWLFIRDFGTAAGMVQTLWKRVE